jgi:GWxTD domain-containing protein
MKKIVIAFSLLVILCTNSLFSVNVTAYLTSATFNIPGKLPYAETYLSVIGNSVKFVKNSNGKYQGGVDITVCFKQNAEIINAQKYTLNSPEIIDTTKGFPNFLDQQRYSLANGVYEMELTIADKNKATDKPFTTIVPITINFSEDKITVSDIQILESYSKSIAPSILTKSGYDMLPYVSTFFPENISKIKLYAEIYNAKKILGDGQKMLVSYFLETPDTKIKLNEYSAFLKQTTSDVNILLTEFNIEHLPSGNYNLIVEVRDKDNKLQAEQACFIQRKNSLGALSIEDLKAINVNNTFVNSYKNIDTLIDYIHCLRPISSSSEIQFAENQLKGGKIELMQQYFYNFWKSRNALEPQITWLEYYKEVMKVNREFSALGKEGFNTDRGRVYLQYGAPSTRDIMNIEPNAYPYEIWQYDVLIDNSLYVTNPHNRQSNKKFIFYTTNSANNDYLLIHSTAIGEIYNIRWEFLIHGRTSQTPNLDAEKTIKHFGGNADEDFSRPK